MLTRLPTKACSSAYGVQNSVDQDTLIGPTAFAVVIHVVGQRAVQQCGQVANGPGEPAGVDRRRLLDLDLQGPWTGLDVDVAERRPARAVPQADAQLEPAGALGGRHHAGPHLHCVARAGLVRGRLDRL